MTILWTCSFVYNHREQSVVAIWIDLLVARSSNNEPQIKILTVINVTEYLRESHFLFIPLIPFQVDKENVRQGQKGPI